MAMVKVDGSSLQAAHRPSGLA